MSCENVCKHNSGFFFQSTPTYRILGMWMCNLGCGFYLNFNPEFKDFPNGIAYTEGPSSRHIKDMPKIDYKAGEL